MNAMYGSSRLPRDARPRLRLRVRRDGALWAESRDDFGAINTADEVSVGVVPGGPSAFELDIELCDRGRVLWRGALRPRVNVHGALGDFIRPLRSPEVDGQIRALQPALVVGPEGVFLAMRDPASAIPGQTVPCTLALEAQILLGDRVVKPVRCRQAPGDPERCTRSACGHVERSPLLMASGGAEKGFDAGQNDHCLPSANCFLGTARHAMCSRIAGARELLREAAIRFPPNLHGICDDGLNGAALNKRAGTYDRVVNT